MRIASLGLLVAASFAVAASARGQTARPDSTHFVRAVIAPPPAAAPRSRASAARRAETLRRRLDYLDAHTIESEIRALDPRKTMGQTLLTSGDMQTTYLAVHRVDSSVPEVHSRWDDLVIVRAGTGAIVFGDSLVGSHYRAPGERRGGTFVGHYQVVVHAGDMIRIPAAVPHAFVVAKGQSLDYVVVKSRQQRLPIRWARAESQPEPAGTTP